MQSVFYLFLWGRMMVKSLSISNSKPLLHSIPS
nr:MAG TPA: hypothetical protein [Caudoviricetes sp.]DAW47060.1 MAG TPA: hypothetical protein [Caudoviricetes sp.]DAY34081.1 MAG TPA: hypothetical protein [Caudoviricetes sp.]